VHRWSRSSKARAPLCSRCFPQTSSLTNHMAEHNQVVGQVIDHLRDVLSTLSNSGDDFSAAVDRLDQAVNGLAADRDPIGDAIDALDRGTASLA